MKVWLSLARSSGSGQCTPARARRRVSSCSRILGQHRGGREGEGREEYGVWRGCGGEGGVWHIKIIHECREMEIS